MNKNIHRFLHAEKTKSNEDTERFYFNIETITSTLFCFDCKMPGFAILEISNSNLPSLIQIMYASKLNSLNKITTSFQIRDT